MSNVIERAENLKAGWQKSPITRHNDFSRTVLWQKQIEILEAYRKYKRVAVKSGNAVGKSYLAADIVLDWLATQYPSKVLTTATSWTQVEDILWKEIRNMCVNSKIRITGELLNTQLKFNDEWFALGISVDKPIRLQGFHSEHLLFVLDEASGIQPEIWDMIEALHPEKIVAIGNPLDNTGNFYDCFSSPLWHCITISCRECVKWQNEHGRIPGLVTQEWISDVESIHGKRSPWVQVHVDGEFPEEAEGTLISRRWVEDARNRKLSESEADEAKVIAVDVASKHGDAETVIGYRYGHTIKQLNGYFRISMTEIRDKLAFLWGTTKAYSVAVDADGIGEGLSEMLAHVHVPYLEFHGGYGQHAEGAEAEKFRNLRTQYYWRVAKKFEKGVYDLSLIPAKEYEILKNQLCCIKVKPPDAMGRIQIETKEDLQARGIKSPDFSDCFVYLEYCWYNAKFEELTPHTWR